MPATPIRFTITEEDLPSGSGLYNEIEVPGDYEVVLTQVVDYDFTDRGKSSGWILSYSCETPSGGTVNFDLYLAHTKNARFKLLETFEAHGEPYALGDAGYDPQTIIGSKVGAHIDFPRDSSGNPTGNFRGIERVFPLVAKPEVDEEGFSTPVSPVNLDEEVPEAL